MFDLFGKKEIQRLKAELETTEIVLHSTIRSLKEAEKSLKEEKEKTAKLTKELAKKPKPVKYATGRKKMTKEHLKTLKAQLQILPLNTPGFSSATVYNKKLKQLETVELSSVKEALDLIDKALKGKIDLVV